MAQQQDKVDALTRVWSSPADHAGWFKVVNNQPLGKRFMVTSFAFFIVGGLLALLMRTQLAIPENTFLGPEAFNRLFTMHGSTMMFLFAVPFLEGLALYVMPLMLGTRDVAFPRLTAFSYWVYLFGGIIFYASFLADAVPNAGWFAYTPLSGPDFSGLGMEFWLLGLSMVEIAGIAAGIELVVTILKLRAPGMSLNRIPIFAWAILVAGLSIIFAFTTLLSATLLLEMDFSLGTKFFHPDYGGSTLLWQHLFWIFGHPEVYIMFIPAAGIMSTVIPIFAQRPLAGYILVAMSLVVTGFVGFGLWVHHMYTTGLPELSLAFFTVASFMVALASGVQIFAWIATLWGRRPKWGNTSFLFTMGFFFLFVLGGITGVMIAVVPFDWQVHDTYFLVAHFHYVLIGGVVFPIFAGLHHWLPKITGQMLSERLGQWSFWLIFAGVNVTFFVMHLTGMQGMPRRVYTYSEALGIEIHNIISTVGAFMIGAGVLVFLVNVAWSYFRGDRAPGDPWRANTIEWSVSSPPPVYSFYAPPVVRSQNPMWDRPDKRYASPLATEASEENDNVRRAVAALAGAPQDWRGTLTTDVLTGEPQAVHHLPGPSYTPLAAALGILLGATGVLANIYLLLPLGLVWSVGAFLSWLWPDEDVLERLRKSDIPEKSGLPIFGADTRSPGWWGAVLLVIVLAVFLTTLIFSYFYIRLYSPAWPQDYFPLPALRIPAIAAAALAISALGQMWTWYSLKKEQHRSFQIGTGITMILGLSYVVLIVLEMSRVDFGVQTNAYGSLFFVICGFSCLLVTVGLALQGATLYRVWKGDLSRLNFFPVQLQITTLFWYFAVAAGILSFGTVFLSPHL